MLKKKGKCQKFSLVQMGNKKTTSTVKKAHSNKPVNEFKRIEK